MDELIPRVKNLIITSLRLKDIRPEDIKDDAPLFAEGLGLDSIDALELVVALEKEFSIKIPDEDVGKDAFASVTALASYIKKNKGLA